MKDESELRSKSLGRRRRVGGVFDGVRDEPVVGGSTEVESGRLGKRGRCQQKVRSLGQCN